MDAILCSQRVASLKFFEEEEEDEERKMRNERVSSSR
jgi:hypothetical protein